ncbi:hypothetical protein, partial [Neisseria meningitidis]|uniref:hypothetical protein n=1 Tax=Neisseria meningitidis TaxID=487 RepID=UPI001C859518
MGFSPPIQPPPPIQPFPPTQTNHSANPRQKPKPPNPDGLPKTLDAVELAGLDELVWQNWWAEAHPTAHPTTRPKSHLRS